MVGSQFEALKGALDCFIAQTLHQLQSLQDSNAHLTLSVATLKAASDARDDEVRRLQAFSQVQQDINSQLLQSLQSLHQKVDTLKVASSPAAEGEKQRIQHSSASGRQAPSSAPVDQQAYLSADVKSAMADHNTSTMVDASSLRSEGEKNEGTGGLTKGKTTLKFL
ncbi:hypothetical protein L6452_14033 [Arctium lappa]|uniref:Uncharacterized protein n=1 Tax=Arctium lappa TaxID=4217 RepID=A0ACB9CKA9_ARCLA|nr:hypothetical protein L6452_14033 [Arctium lappa]